MRKIGAIFKREFSAFFYSPMAYVVLAAWTFMNGILMALVVQALSQPGATQSNPMELLQGGTIFTWIFVFAFLAVVTMRLMAEERVRGTMETLFTTPVSELQVVIGKYFAAVCFYLIAQIPILIYVWILSNFGELDWGPVSGGFVGILMVGFFLLAIGLFWSTVVGSQVAAAILSFASFIALFMVSIASMVFQGGPFHKVLEYADLFQHLQNMAKGIIDTRALGYTGLGTLLFLILTITMLKTERWR